MTIGKDLGRITLAYKDTTFKASPEVLPEWIVGLELEIEGWDGEAERDFVGFEFTDDGSLRNSDNGRGIEAITAPIQIQYVRDLLTRFFKHYHIDGTNYSERCSVHVHFNVQPLEWEQLSSICLIYQTVERVLFKFIGSDRDQNIFCVPWSQCNLTCNIIPNIKKYRHDAFRGWQKYTSLNLLPILDKGTIEFRHMHGTCDVDKIMMWIGIISKMFKYAMAHPTEKILMDIQYMNTISNYQAWMYLIFEELTPYLQTVNYDVELAQGVVDTKLMFMNKEAENRNVNRDVAQMIRDLEVGRFNRFDEVEVNPAPPQGVDLDRVAVRRRNT